MYLELPYRCCPLETHVETTKIFSESVRSHKCGSFHVDRSRKFEADRNRKTGGFETWNSQFRPLLIHFLLIGPLYLSKTIKQRRIEITGGNLYSFFFNMTAAILPDDNTAFCRYNRLCAGDSGYSTSNAPPTIDIYRNQCRCVRSIILLEGYDISLCFKVPHEVNGLE